MNAAVNVFAYTHDWDLLRMVDSLGLVAGEHCIYVHNHSQKPSVAYIADYISRHYPSRVYDWRENRGLSRSINDTFIHAYAQGAEFVINSNDDTVWGAGDLQRLMNYARAHEKGHYAIQAMGTHSARGREGMTHAACLFYKSAFDVVGCWDENFYPAYFEDIDAGRRAMLAGLALGLCPDTNVWHYGSATLAHDSQLEAAHHDWFKRNEAYYVRKWGGKIGSETYTTPFNDPSLGLRIAPENRHRPYGEYDREELKK